MTRWLALVVSKMIFIAIIAIIIIINIITINAVIIFICIYLQMPTVP